MDVSANAIRVRTRTECDTQYYLAFSSKFYIVLISQKKRKNKDQSSEDWVQTENETQIREYVAQ